MKTILLTGVAGFIGSHTAERLIQDGHQVIGVDNLNEYYNPEWKEENLDRVKATAEASSGKFKFYQADIRHKQVLAEIFEQHPLTHIIHLAARAGVRASIEQPELYQEVNISGTLNLLELAHQHHNLPFIFASSSSVYGNQTKVPFSETDACNQPISPYAATKKSTEMWAHTYSHLHQMQTIALRFFTVYGPAGRPDMAPYLFTEAILNGDPIKKFGDGSTRRDYTYIDDIVSGVVACLDLDSQKHQFEIINLGNNTPVTLNEFIETLEEITGKEMKYKQLPMQPGDVEQTYADIEKAQQLLGYEPTTSFKEGLSKFVKWYQENRLK